MENTVKKLNFFELKEGGKIRFFGEERGIKLNHAYNPSSLIYEKYQKGYIIDFEGNSYEIKEIIEFPSKIKYHISNILKGFNEYSGGRIEFEERAILIVIQKIEKAPNKAA